MEAQNFNLLTQTQHSGLCVIPNLAEHWESRLSIKNTNQSMCLRRHNTFVDAHTHTYTHTRGSPVLSIGAVISVCSY